MAEDDNTGNGKTGEQEAGQNGGDKTTHGSDQPATGKPGAKEAVDVSLLGNENPNLMELDWGAADKGTQNSFFSGPTRKVEKPANPQPNASTATNTTNGSGKTSTFGVGIKVLVAIIDFAISTACQKIAKDSSPVPYQAQPDSKKILEDSIVAILEENNTVKIPTWLIVVFAFLSAYGFQIMAAIESRKNLKGGSEDTSLKAGVFERDGKIWRRYANGSEREVKFDKNGREIIIGQPTLKTRATRVHKQAA